MQAPQAAVCRFGPPLPSLLRQPGWGPPLGHRQRRPGGTPGAATLQARASAQQAERPVAWPHQDLIVRTEPTRAGAGTRLLQQSNPERDAAAPAPVSLHSLQVLGALLPGMSDHRLRQLPVGLLRQLAADVGGVCARLVKLRDLFPGANVVELVNRRPALLLQEEFEAAPAARAELRRLFPEADVDRMVEGQPLLLVEDVGEAISELQRLMPGVDPMQTLKYQSHMLTSVLKTRKLSLW